MSVEPMIWIMASAVTVGFVHSMAPGHWLPVVLMAKARGWTLRTAVAASMVTAAGHIFLSVLIAAIAVLLGASALEKHEHLIESYAGLGLAAFGVIFAIRSYFRHSSCRGHTHHGPEPEGEKQPIREALGFLFLVGLSPCVAIYPVFAAAIPWGAAGWFLTGACFAIGVLAALGGAVLTVSLGALKLDHPLFEHYGDVLTGIAMALLGIGFFLFSEPHLHGAIP